MSAPSAAMSMPPLRRQGQIEVVLDDSLARPALGARPDGPLTGWQMRHGGTWRAGAVVCDRASIVLAAFDGRDGLTRSAGRDASTGWARRSAASVCRRIGARAIPVLSINSCSGCLAPYSGMFSARHSWRRDKVPRSDPGRPAWVYPEQPQDRLAGLVPDTLACRHGVQPIRGPNRIRREPPSLSVRDGQFRLCQVEGRGRLMRDSHRAGFRA